MREIVRSVCPLDCPDTCSLRVEREDGRILSVDGNRNHPVTRGAICNKVRHFPLRTHHPERLLTPLKRVGEKGTLDFKRITWDEALREIVGKFNSIIEDYGASSILPYSFYGNMGILNAEGMDRRFFHRLGASRLERTICNAAGATGYQYTMGANAGIDPEDTVHSKLIIVWGCNLISTNMHQIMLANEARKNGATIVVIDVHRNRTGKWVDWFIGLRPGTDAALALGIMHVLIRDGLVDTEFISAHTVGYDELGARASEYTPSCVEEITGVKASDVERLAHLYGTTTPSFIRIGNGLQHHDNGGMIVRTIACLPALTGQWGIQGGGAIKGNSYYAGLNTMGLQRPDLMPDKRVRSINMNRLGEALLAADPPVKALFVYNSNPALVAPNQSKVRAGLIRSDLFTVVHDLFLTDTCKYADIVLPATSHFENLDLYKSYWHLYVQLHEPVIEPVGECKSNFTLFRELAKRMGFTDECFNDTEEDMIRTALDNPANPYLKGVTFEALREHGWMKLNIEQKPPFPNHLPTPSGKIELFSERLARKGIDPVPVHNPLPEEETYPLMFICGPNHHFLNSTGANLNDLKQAEKRPTIQIHPEDARPRHISDGQKVRVLNQRGTIELTAQITTDVLQGVVVTQGLWWDDESRGFQSVNFLTSDRIADMGGGATFFSNRVDVVPVQR